MRKRFRWTIAVCMGVMLMPSCGHDQKLVSIDIQPATETFGASNIPVSADAGASVQLRATGTYIHPPGTKDITSQVIWSSNTPQMVIVDSTGVITATGQACGGTIIYATVNQSGGFIVTGSMNANVVCFGSGGGGGSGPQLTVNFMGAGSGTIATTPPSAGCSVPPSTPCIITFTSGTSVVLTASPTNGSTFGGWADCDAGSAGTVCLVNSLTGNRSVTATFN